MKIPSGLYFLSAGPTATAAVLLGYWVLGGTLHTEWLQPITNRLEETKHMTAIVAAIVAVPLLVIAGYVYVGHRNIKKHGRPDIQ